MRTRPRNWKHERTVIPGGYVIDGEPATPLQHSMDIGVELCAIWNIHRDVLCSRMIEAVRCEGQVQRIHNLIRNLECYLLRQQTGSRNKRLSHVDASHMTIVVCGEETRGPAQPAPDVQQRGTGAQT